jgi:hypothetical protein
MPFGGWLDDYYDSIYCPAIESAGLEPHRADDLYRPSTIVTDIWEYTKKAKLLVADLTNKNPNVFYELGLAHALAKPAILVAESMEDIPFDLRALRVIVYDKNDPKWGEILQEKIQSSITEVLRSPQEAVLPAFLRVKDGPDRLTVSAHQKEMIEIKQELDLLRREVRMRSGEGEPKRQMIGPSEARAMIQDMLARKYPDKLIINRVARLGPPRGWVQENIDKIRGKGEVRTQKEVETDLNAIDAIENP